MPLFASKINAVIPVLSFLARHLLFVVFEMLAGCVLWVVAYFLLLAIAVIGDQGVGGPLALPAGLIAVIGSCIFLGWGVFAPASAIGAIFCGLLKLPRLAAIPIVTVAAFVLTYVVYRGYIELVTTHSMPSGWTVLKNFAIHLSVPLGVYWWLTEGPGALFDSFRRWIRSCRQNKTISEQVERGTPDPPRVQSAMAIQNSTRSRSRAPGQGSCVL